MLNEGTKDLEGLMWFLVPLELWLHCGKFCFSLSVSLKEGTEMLLKCFSSNLKTQNETKRNDQILYSISLRIYIKEKYLGIERSFAILNGFYVLFG